MCICERAANFIRAVRAEPLRKWVHQSERDSGVQPGLTTAEQQRIKDLEREVRELRKNNEIPELASAHIAQRSSTAITGSERLIDELPSKTKP